MSGAKVIVSEATLTSGAWRTTMTLGPSPGPVILGVAPLPQIQPDDDT